MKISPRQKVIQALRERIEAGELSIENRLPTENEISLQLDVSRGTVRHGLEELINEGLLERRHGVGVFVSKNIPVKIKSVALLAPSINNRYILFDHLIEGIENIAFDNNCSLVLCNIERSPQKAITYIKRLKRQKTTGVIFAPLICENFEEVNQRILNELTKEGLEYVIVDSPISSESLEKDSFVGTNNYLAMRKLVRHLHQKGYDTICSIRVFPGVYSSDQRYKGLEDEVKALGLEFNPLWHKTVHGNDPVNHGRDEAKALFQEIVTPFAVVCNHDLLAYNFIEESEKAGLAIPADIAVATFDNNVSMSGYLTSIHQNHIEIGREACRILLEKLNGNLQNSKHILIEGDLICRESTEGKK